MLAEKYFSFVSLRTLWQHYKNILKIFLAVKLALFVIILTCANLLPFSQRDYEVNSDHFDGQKQFQLGFQLSPYDGPQYLRIAYYGYPEVVKTDTKIYAWFPLYPFLMRGAAWFFAGGDLSLAGILISLIASLLGVLLFYELALLDYPESTARRAVFYFLIFPAAIFSIAVYTESLFFLLSILTVYLSRQKHWWLSGAFGYLAALTRPNGFLLALPLAVEYFASAGKNWWNYFKENRCSLFALLLPPLGLLTFFAYSYLSVGDFFYYFKSLSFWGKGEPSFSKIFIVLFDRLAHFSELPFHNFHFSRLDMVFTLLFLAGLWGVFKKTRLSYAFYASVFVLLPLASGDTMSMLRYLSISFPHFLYLGYLGSRFRLVHRIILMVFLPLFILLTLRFVNWHWVG